MQEGIITKCESVAPRFGEKDILELLDQQSLQAMLLKLADQNLGRFIRSSNKTNLAFPICRFADEDLMAVLTERAAGWQTNVDGYDAPCLEAFRRACMYSNTRAAMLLADRYFELDKYASIRGVTADELRDMYFSDVGLDAECGKVFDLGIQTVKAKLQNDLSFLFVRQNGKTVKQLPKKGADPEKYAAAKKEFSELKLNTETILKNRENALFADFLSGRTRPGKEWKLSYLSKPLMRKVASLIVWSQEHRTFILTEFGAIDSAEQPFRITDADICVAHPLEMSAEDTASWRKYFITHGLKQPFNQIWEPVRTEKEIKKDRYDGCVISAYVFCGEDKHGIISRGVCDYSDGFFSLTGCSLNYKIFIDGPDYLTGAAYCKIIHSCTVLKSFA